MRNEDFNRETNKILKRLDIIVAISLILFGGHFLAMVILFIYAVVS